MDAGLVAAIAAVVALPIYVIQWLTGRAAARNAEIDLLREMRADWMALKPQWHRAILTAIGPDDYYSPASMQIRTEFRQLVERMAAEPDLESEDWHKWHQETRDRSHEYEQAERDVLFFLATLASVVFKGRLSPDLAYTVVGLDTVRRSRQIRTLLGVDSPSWYLASQEGPEPDLGESPTDSEIEALVHQEMEEDGPECPWVYWVDSIPGLTDRILGLLDVLWAEAARRYDLQTHDLVNAALLKQGSGSGLRNRLRVRRLAKEHGGSGMATWRLERGLLAGEFLRLGPPRRIDMVELELIPPPVQAWGIKGWGRRLRAFSLGRFRRCRKHVDFALPAPAGKPPGRT
jgi:hypothetical protein